MDTKLVEFMQIEKCWSFIWYNIPMLMAKMARRNTFLLFRRLIPWMKSNKLLIQLWSMKKLYVFGWNTTTLLALYVSHSRHQFKRESYVEQRNCWRNWKVSLLTFFECCFILIKTSRKVKYTWYLFDDFLLSKFYDCCFL